MPEIRATLLLEVDGVSLPDFPIIKRLVVNEIASLGDLIATPDSNTTSYHAIAAAIMATMGVFVMTTDQAVNLKFNLNTPISMNADGLVLIMGCALAQGTPSQNVEYNNPSSSVNANLGIVVAGS